MSSDESGESDSTPIFRNSEDIRNDARPDIIREYNAHPHTMISGFSIAHNNATHLSTITFKLGDCSVTAQYTTNGDIYIHSFSCNTVGSGLGKNLLHDALIHLKTIYPDFAYITIDPVPQMDPATFKTLSPADKETHKQTALLKLAGYYKKLGFMDEIQSQDNDGSYPTLIGDINTILATIETMNRSKQGRGTRRTRGKRKVVNKRKSNKKGKKGKKGKNNK